MEKSNTIIQCKRHFHHPVKKVFNAFLDPLSIKAWFGPKEFLIGNVTVAAEVNGRLEIEMITPKNDVLWVKGTYTEIIADRKIAYTFKYEPDGPNLGVTLVTIYFKGNNIGTEVTLIQTIYKTINPEGRAKGWEAGFDKLETLLETN